MPDQTLDGTGLVPFPKKGRPSGSRIKDAASLRSVYWQMRQDDLISGGQRFAINQQINGAQPYLTSAKKRAGSVGGSNLNFGEASARIRQTLTTYNDMLDPLRAFIEPEIPLDLYDDTTRQNAEDIIAEEFTTMVRDWGGFESRKQLLSKEFVTHGVALAYFPNDDDWKFDVAGFDNFLIPRATRIGEENVDILLMTKDEIPSKVYERIENEKAATDLGWDVEATKQALVRATSFAGKQLPPTWGLEWDTFSKMIKGNDLGSSYSTTARVYEVHGLIREYDGSFSHYITERNPSGGKDNITTDFLYKRVSRFPAGSDPFTIFCLNVGDGEYHSVRGQGYDQFAHVQTSNKMLNDLVNQFRRGACTMLHKKDSNALDEAPIVISNGMAIISPDVDFVEQNVQDHTRTSMPVLDFFSRKLDSVSPVENSAPGMNGPVMTKYQLQALQGTGSALNTSAINMFNRSWKRLLREMWRRLQEIVAEEKHEPIGEDDEPEFPEVGMFVARCARRGVTTDMILQVERINEVRAVGAGSPQMQQVIMDRLMQLMPSFDEPGRNRAIHDDLTLLVGTRRANRYYPLQAKPRPVIDQKVALLENGDMFGGGDVPPLDGENHTVHAMVHMGQQGDSGPNIASSIQVLEDWRNNGEQGSITDLQPHIAFLALIIPHTEQHVQAMAADPSRVQLAASYKKALQEYAATWMTYMRQLEKVLNEQKAQEEQQPQPDPEKLQKIAESQQKMDIALRDFLSREQLKVADVQDRMRIRQHESDVKMSIAINKANADKLAKIPEGDPMALELPSASRSDDVTNRSAHTPNV